ncbi:hypothetical protein KXR53_01980 [Inquilinus limosus]|uniref:hypothetical protein n=1 Tax=Inquilinus limosus TaxID=171674 RepID=UPI003F137D76
MASRWAWMLAATALAFPLPVVAQQTPEGGTNNSCIFAHDGECDEANGTCAPGTDSADCRPEAVVEPANACRYAFDQRCDEPGKGSGLCAAGTDTADCAAATPAPPPSAPAQGPSDDSCPFARDNECDEPGIGSGACAAGTDTTDCKARRGDQPVPTAPATPTGQGDDSCPFARDGDCDEPDIGSGACAAGTDATDCKAKAGTGQAPAAPAAPSAAGDDSCQFAQDGECDEPGRGTGLCSAGTDATDCSAAGGDAPSTGSGGAATPAACPFTGDGECDEPGKGSGLCAAGTDAEDCRGK